MSPAARAIVRFLAEQLAADALAREQVDQPDTRADNAAAEPPARLPLPELA